MNDARRKRLREAAQLIEDARAILQECKEGEDDYFNNMPENMQQGERGQRAEEVSNALDDADTALETVASELEDYCS